MSDTDTSGFGKFVPGFDFLQNLAKGATSNIPQMPNLGNWVAPTLNVEELEKRIDELKAVHFWLEQNSRALGATIQALEVQKMTLATLKGMNFNIGDVANALKLKAAESVQTGVQRVSERAASTAKTISDVATGNSSAASKAGKAASGVGALVDPLHLWGSLTQQFQQIAAGAFKEATTKTAIDVTKNMASGMAKEALKSAKAAGKKAATGAVKRATKPAARKVAPNSR
ncbi:MAG: PhaM family polyhydroxyalkanoate granule multifunctional regulatory protein [Pseudomonadota bacterium]